MYVYIYLYVYISHYVSKSNFTNKFHHNHHQATKRVRPCMKVPVHHLHLHLRSFCAHKLYTVPICYDPENVCIVESGM